MNQPHRQYIQQEVNALIVPCNRHLKNLRPNKADKHKLAESMTRTDAK